MIDRTGVPRETQHGRAHARVAVAAPANHLVSAGERGSVVTPRHLDERQGLVTYRVSAGTCELVTLDSLQMGLGVGSALVEAVVQEAQRAACTRLFLITTNDNIGALRFYQRRGWVLAALRREALEVSRRLKPSIPAVGRNGIPLRDELELEYPL